MAIVWPCPVSVERYATDGCDVVVPRPLCPSCAVPMQFRSVPQRWPTGPPAAAVAAIGWAHQAAVERWPTLTPSVWGFVSVIVGGALIGPANTTSPWRVFGNRRFMPPPRTRGDQEEMAVTNEEMERVALHRFAVIAEATTPPDPRTDPPTHTGPLDTQIRCRHRPKPPFDTSHQGVDLPRAVRRCRRLSSQCQPSPIPTHRSMIRDERLTGAAGGGT